MGRYRKKPVVIDAVQWTGENWAEIEAFGDKVLPLARVAAIGYIVVETAEGPLKVQTGDWIIRDVKGEFYPCKPDIFALTYDPAEAPPWLIEIALRVAGAKAARNNGIRLDTSRLAADDANAVLKWFSNAISDQERLIAAVTGE